jgi:hypothetical protein
VIPHHQRRRQRKGGQRSNPALTQRRARYESIHKAVQYKNIGITQIAIVNDNNGTTIDLKEVRK